MTEAGEQQLYNSLDTALANGDTATLWQIYAENPDIYQNWTFKGTNSLQASALGNVPDASIQFDETGLRNQGLKNSSQLASVNAGNAAEARAAALGINPEGWEQFDVNGDGVLLDDEIAEYNKANYDTNNSDPFLTDIQGGETGTKSTYDAITNWGDETGLSTLANATGASSVNKDLKNSAEGALTAVATGDVSDATDAGFDALGNMLVLNQNENFDKANEAANIGESAARTVGGGTVSATQSAVDSGKMTYDAATGDWNQLVDDAYDFGTDVDETMLSALSSGVNNAMDEINYANTGERNGTGTVGFTENVANAAGAAVTGDNSFDKFNQSELGDTVSDAVDKVEDSVSGLGNSDGEGGSGTSSGNNIFSNADEVNNILTNGTRAAQQTYGEQTATALQPLTEAKDAYNYKSQLDNYNQDWQNYKEQTASNNAYLDTQKDAAQNWETYMNPLTEYLNKQIAANYRDTAGSQGSSGSVLEAKNKAIADNTASQYQNAVNTAITNAQNNQNIANSSRITPTVISRVPTKR